MDLPKNENTSSLVVFGHDAQLATKGVESDTLEGAWFTA
jgi:hypothetical protein